MKTFLTYRFLSFFVSCLFLFPLIAKGQLDSLQLNELKIDSSVIEIREFNRELIENYKQREEFDYSSRMPDLTWIERVLESIIRFLNRSSNTTSLITEIVIYVGIAIALIIFILNILKLKPQLLFGRKGKAASLDFESIEKNLDEADFESLIKEAEERKEFKIALRLLYLESIKSLSQAKLIDWKIDKTNHDYERELNGTPFKDSFSKLTYSFERVWYGDFPVSEVSYKGVKEIFSQSHNQLSHERIA